jgi:hypothetical protein
MKLLRYLPILGIIFCTNAMAKTSTKSLDELMESSIEVCIDLHHNAACAIVAIDQDSAEVFTFITDIDQSLVESALTTNLSGVTSLISAEDYVYIARKIPGHKRIWRDIEEMSQPLLLKAVSTCDYAAMACLGVSVINPFIGFSCGLHQILICTNW